jgi:hypothetical protein
LRLLQANFNQYAWYKKSHAGHDDYGPEDQDRDRRHGPRPATAD